MAEHILGSGNMSFIDNLNQQLTEAETVLENKKTNKPSSKGLTKADLQQTLDSYLDKTTIKKPSKAAKPVQAEAKKPEVDKLEEDREKNILLIRRYECSPVYSKYLKNDMKISFDLDKKNGKQVKATLDKIRMVINNKSSSNVIETGVKFISGTAETLSSNGFIPVDLKGWTDVIEADIEMKEMMEQLNIEYGSWANISVEKRFIWAFVKSGAKVHAINMMKKSHPLPATNNNSNTATIPNNSVPVADLTKQTPKLDEQPKSTSDIKTSNILDFS
jgi:hypothetical protein